MSDAKPPFTSFNPNPDPMAGLAPNLIPTPPKEMPSVPDLPTAAEPYAFQEAQDFDSIVKNYTIDRPLPLYIPRELMHSKAEYHFINNTPEEMAAAMRRHWRPVTDPALLALTEGKNSGTTKEGRITKLVLMERDRRFGEHEAKLKRQLLADQNKGLDPKQRVFNGGKNVTDGKDASEGQFRGLGIGRIRV
jgi:hypothetical protein